MPGAVSLEARALRWLSQREHSRAELRVKLLRSLAREQRATGEEPEGSSSKVDALLESLQARGYLSDARFAESRVRVRAPRFGAQRITQELKRHGVELDAESERQLRESELQRAKEVWRRRFGGRAGDAVPPPAECARQARFLIARGFASDVVRRVLREAGNPEADDAS